jgi:hypothetical protein
MITRGSNDREICFDDIAPHWRLTLNCHSHRSDAAT